MKRLQHITYLIVMFLSVSCYDDDSTLALKEIDEIEITNSARDTINLYLGDMVSITNGYSYIGDDLSCQWGMGKYTEDPITGEVTTVFKEISTGPDLAYKTRDLGHYYLRQVVTNTSGSTIRYYHVFVNSEYEEGYLILGRKEDGKGSLAFMKTLTAEEEAQGLRPAFRQDLFGYTNDGMDLGLGPVDCDKVDDKLYILCSGDRKVYQIDAKSFQLIYVFDFNAYGEDYIPQDLISYDSRYCREIYTTSPNGGAAKIQILDLEIFRNGDLPQGVKFTRTVDRPNDFSSYVAAYIDDENSKIYANGFDMNTFDFGYFPCYDHFDGRKIIQVFFDEEGNLIVYSCKEGKYLISKIGPYITNLGTMSLDLIYENECTENPRILDEASILQVNDIYSCLLFGKGDRIYRWAYNQAQLPAEPFIVLPENEIVRCMGQSRDQRQVFVATYNGTRSGLKGSFYRYDSDSGVLLESHEGIADDPVKVMYKEK